MSEEWQPINERLVQEHVVSKVPQTDTEVFAVFQSFGMLGEFLKPLYILYRSEGYKMNVLDAYGKVMREYAEMGNEKAGAQ